MKVIKRSRALLVALVMLVSFLLVFSSAVFAENGVKLSAGSESGKEGDVISVAISIENAEETGGGEFELSFDPEKVKPVEIDKGAFVSDANNDQFMANLEFAANKLKVMWVTPELDTAASGTVCTIQFELLEEGESSLSFHAVVLAPEGVELDTAAPGKIEVTDPVDEKQQAIDAANKAIADLPDPEDITLEDKEDVEAARALVNKAKNDFGAVDDDFDDLAKLVAAEKMIGKLEAIEAANKAIADLPDPEDITLADKAAVEAARALVNKAKNDFGAVDADFEDLDKLVEAERIIAKLVAIKAADDAILALPSVDVLTLDDKPAVVAARALVNKAKDEHGAVDSDFMYLDRLRAAENRIKELEGLEPTPPTGDAAYWLPLAMLVILAGLIAYFKKGKTVTG